MQVYVREFKENKFSESDTTYYPLSTYFPYPMKDALHNLVATGHIRKSDYILGPIYKNTKDLQIGVTGTVENKEETKQTTARELGEEIGLVPIDKDFLDVVKCYNHNNKSFIVYTLDIKNSFPVLDHQHDAVLSKYEDTKTKVGCFVHGTKKTICNFLNKKNIYVYNSNDGIIGVGAIRVGLLF